MDVFLRKVQLNDDETWKGISEIGVPKEATIKLSDDLLRQFVFRLDGADLEIGFIEFDALLTLIVPKMPLVQAAEYVSQRVDSAQEETFVKLGRWIGSDTSHIKELIVLAYARKEFAAQ